MYEIGHGIDVYYENEKNILLFADGRCKHYSVGGLLFEIISDKSYYLMLEKSKNMIQAFPDYQASITENRVTNAFQWIYGTVEDEELPVATEIFKSCFSEIIMEILGAGSLVSECSNVGELMMECYEQFYSHMRLFSLLVDSLADVNSKNADDLSQELITGFKEEASELYYIYRKKCSVRKRRGRVSVEVHNIKTPVQLLVFEYSRMQKNNQVLKKCTNCSRYFIPESRNDAIFCTAQSPQNPQKTCREIGGQVRRQKKRDDDPGEKEHNRIYSRCAMNAKRASDRGEDPSYYWDKMEEEINRYKDAKGGIIGGRKNKRSE